MAKLKPNKLERFVPTTQIADWKMGISPMKTINVRRQNILVD